MLFSNILFNLDNVNSATSGDPNNPSRGIVGNAYDNFVEEFQKAIMDSWHSIGDEIRNGLISFGESLTKGLFTFLNPIIEFGCKTVLIFCIVIYYCTDCEDKKSVRTGIVVLIMFVVFQYIKGVFL